MPITKKNKKARAACIERFDQYAKKMAHKARIAENDRVVYHQFFPLNVKVVGTMIYSNTCYICGNFVDDEHRDDPCPVNTILQGEEIKSKDAMIAGIEKRVEKLDGDSRQ
jgi:rubrerythrin